jgi:hypothetical protein
VIRRGLFSSFVVAPRPSAARSFVRWFRHEEIEMRQTRESIKWKLISVMDRRADAIETRSSGWISIMQIDTSESIHIARN